MSPWLTFAKEILQGAGVPVGLIPAALGGSSLCAWDTGNPDGAYLYENMIDLIAAAGGKVAGMVWYQGCSDTRSEETASTYLARFTRFVEAFRARYGANLPIITAQLNRWLDVLSRSWNTCGHWCARRSARRRAPFPTWASSPRWTCRCPTASTPARSATSSSDSVSRAPHSAWSMARRFPGTRWTLPAPASPMRNARRSASSFSHVVDHLVLLAVHPQDFLLEDEDGAVPVQAARVEGTADVVLELAHSARGKTVCHNLYGANPVSTLRDHLQRPVLAFHGVEVE